MLNRKQKVFLAAYAELGNIRTAARLAGCARSQHYWWLKKPDYAKAFAEAREEAYDVILSEIRRRAVDGVELPVIYRGQLCYERDSRGRPTNRPLTIRRYSDRLLMFLLKVLMPEKYDERYRASGPSTSELQRRLDAGRARVAAFRTAEDRRAAPKVEVVFVNSSERSASGT